MMALAIVLLLVGSALHFLAAMVWSGRLKLNPADDSNALLRGGAIVQTAAGFRTPKGQGIAIGVVALICDLAAVALLVTTVL